MMEDIAIKQKSMQKHNISEDLVVYIKQQIIEGALNPGDRIVETKLAKELGISQTPVREALRQLQGEGVILIVPNKGPQVCDLTMRDVFEIYSVRSVLEGLAIRQATQNASDSEIEALEAIYEAMKADLGNDEVKDLLSHSFQIHQLIVDLSQHSRLISMYKSITFQIAMVNRILGTRSTKQKEVDQHWELIDAMKRRDPDYAEQTIRQHIYRSYHEFIALNGDQAEPIDIKLWL